MTSDPLGILFEADGFSVALWDHSVQGVCRNEGNLYYTYFVGGERTDTSVPEVSSWVIQYLEPAS